MRHCDTPDYHGCSRIQYLELRSTKVWFGPRGRAGRRGRQVPAGVPALQADSVAAANRRVARGIVPAHDQRDAHRLPLRLRLLHHGRQLLQRSPPGPLRRFLWQAAAPRSVHLESSVGFFGRIGRRVCQCRGCGGGNAAPRVPAARASAASRCGLPLTRLRWALQPLHHVPDDDGRRLERHGPRPLRAVRPRDPAARPPRWRCGSAPGGSGLPMPERLVGGL